MDSRAFEFLSIDILEHIYLKLLSFRDKALFALVCKNWHALTKCSNIWHQIMKELIGTSDVEGLFEKLNWRLRFEIIMSFPAWRHLMHLQMFSEASKFSKQGPYTWTVRLFIILPKGDSNCASKSEFKPEISAEKSFDRRAFNEPYLPVDSYDFFFADEVQSVSVIHNSQSLWIRFRLPVAWADKYDMDGGEKKVEETRRREAARCKPQVALAVIGSIPGHHYRDKSHFFEGNLHIHSSSPPESARKGEFGALLSLPFRLPSNDKERFYQSHHEGLYIWQTDEEEEVELAEDSDSSLEDDDDDKALNLDSNNPPFGDESHFGSEWSDEVRGGREGGGLNLLDPDPNRTRQMDPMEAIISNNTSLDPQDFHMVAYSHMEQLLPRLPRNSLRKFMAVPPPSSFRRLRRTFTEDGEKEVREREGGERDGGGRKGDEREDDEMEGEARHCSSNASISHPLLSFPLLSSTPQTVAYLCIDWCQLKGRRLGSLIVDLQLLAKSNCTSHGVTITNDVSHIGRNGHSNYSNLLGFDFDAEAFGSSIGSDLEPSGSRTGRNTKFQIQGLASRRDILWVEGASREEEKTAGSFAAKWVAGLRKERRTRVGSGNSKNKRYRSISNASDEDDDVSKDERNATKDVVHFLERMGRKNAMVDFAIYDKEGRLLLGRAGVEIWTNDVEKRDGMVLGASRLHFLMDPHLLEDPEDGGSHNGRPEAVEQELRDNSVYVVWRRALKKREKDGVTGEVKEKATMNDEVEIVLSLPTKSFQNLFSHPSPLTKSLY